MILDEFLFKLKLVYESSVTIKVNADLKKIGNTAEETTKKASEGANKVEKEAAKGLKALIGLFTGWQSKLSEFVQNAKSVTQEVGSVVGKFYGWMKRVDQQSALKLMQSVQKLQKEFKKLGTLFDCIFDDVAKEIITMFLPYLLRIIEATNRWLQKNKSLIKEGFEVLATSILRISKAVNRLFQFLEETGLLVPVVMLLAGAFLYLKKAMVFGNLASSGLALLANPITWVIVGIGILLLLLDDLLTYLEGGDSLFGSYWDPIIEGANEVLNWVRCVLSALMDWWDEAGPAIMETLSSIWTSICTIVGKVIDFLMKRKDVILRIFKGVFQFIKGAVQLILGFLRLILSFITGDTRETEKAFKQMLEGIKNIFKGAWEAILALVEIVADAIMALWMAYIDWLEQKWEAFKAKVKAIWDEFTNYISSKIDEMQKDFDEFCDEMVALFNASIDEFSARWEDFKKEAEARWNEFKNFVSSKLDELQRDFNAFCDDMEELLHSTIDEMNAQWQDFKARADALWEDLKNTAKSKIDELENSFNSFCDDIRKKIDSTVNEITEYWYQLKDDALHIWDLFKEGVDNIIEEIKNICFSAVGDIIDRFKPLLDIIDNIKNGVGRFLSGDTRIDLNMLPQGIDGASYSNAAMSGFGAGNQIRDVSLVNDLKNNFTIHSLDPGIITSMIEGALQRQSFQIQRNQKSAMEV